MFSQWGAKALKNMLIVPPGSGIVHQVNLEYLARVVFDEQGLLYPDSVVGTDSHTTMINGLGVVGWGEYAPARWREALRVRIVARRRPSDKTSLTTSPRQPPQNIHIVM